MSSKVESSSRCQIFLPKRRSKSNESQFVLFRYYYDKDILAKIQGKRYAYRFNFKALSLACQAQQSPMPSDAKIDDLNKVLAPLLHHQRTKQSDSYSETEQISISSTETAVSASAEESYQVPDRVLPPYESDLSELPDLGANIWSDFRWPHPPSASSSDCNSPSSLNNVMSPASTTAAAPVPPASLMPPPPPPPTYEHTFHSRSNSVPANMYYGSSFEDFEEM